MKNLNRYIALPLAVTAVGIGFLALNKQGEQDRSHHEIIFESTGARSGYIEGGILLDGANIRTFPEKYENNSGQSDNLCAEEIAKAIVFDQVQVVQAPGDANGPYYGFNLTDFFEQSGTGNQQLDGCRADESGYIWTIKDNVIGEFIPDPIQQ